MSWQEFIYAIIMSPPAWIMTLMVSGLAIVAVTHIWRFRIYGKSPEDKLTFTSEIIMTLGLFILTFHAMTEYHLNPDKISPLGPYSMPFLFIGATMLSINQFKSTAKEAAKEHKNKKTKNPKHKKTDKKNRKKEK